MDYISSFHEKEGKKKLSGICKEEDCEKRAYFNFKGETKVLFCSKHKLFEMIDVKHKMCIFPTCGTRACFNFEGGTKILYCAKHKEQDMVNVVNKYCFFSGCKIQPYYNFRNERNGLYCFQHKDPMMINVKHKTCKFIDCEINPCYNLPRESRGIYCFTHKEENMINVVCKPCAFQDCESQPYYNFSGELRGLYCPVHKETNMINVLNRRCLIQYCTIHAKYGYPSTSKTHCSSHKLPKMILQPNKRCTTNNCNELAIYGVNSSRNHCETHKESQEINLLERPCKSCNLPNILNSFDICQYCDPSTFKVVRLAKQKEVEDFLLVNNYTFTTDKTIDQGECGKERPDFLFFIKHYIIIIEVDEDQHRSRPCECEQTRMINIYNSLQMSTVFIRYNPDKFKINNQNKEVTKNCRLNELKTWLDYYLTNSPEESLIVIHLFFDNDDNSFWQKNILPVI